MSEPHTITDEDLKRFFHEFLLPIAAAAKARGIEFFPQRFDPGVVSYFKERSGDQTYIHEIDADDLAGELRSMWSGDSSAELSLLAENLAKLAAGLGEKESQNDEVSPFVYAMF